MATEPADSPDRERLLDEALLAWLRAAEAGQQPDRGEWLRGYPDLAAELAQFFPDRDQAEPGAAPRGEVPRGQEDQAPADPAAAAGPGAPSADPGGGTDEGLTERPVPPA